MVVHAFEAWLKALQKFLQESKTSCLDIQNLGFAPNEVISVLEVLRSCNVSELNLDQFTRDETWCSALIESNVRELSITKSSSSGSSIIALWKVLDQTNITHLKINVLQFVKQPLDWLTLLREKAIKPTMKTLEISRAALDDEGTILFVDQLCETTITKLGLQQCRMDLSYLFFKLSSLPLTELNLSHCSFTTLCQLKMFSTYLKDSKIQKLDLSSCFISDAGMNILGDGLRGSEVRHLNLEHNQFCGKNDFGRFLKDTKIVTLKLGRNEIRQSRMFTFPEFLKNTAVESLDMHSYFLSDKISESLIQSLANTKVSSLNVSGNCLNKLSISAFAKNIDAMNVVDLNLALEGMFPHFEAAFCYHRNMAPTLFDQTAFPFVTHLYLKNHTAGKELIELLVKHLKISNLAVVDISHNGIKSAGAIALASSFKVSRLLSLNLSGNQIENDALKFLAKEAQDTFITSLNINDNPGKQKLKIDTVLWKNRAAAHKVVEAFKQIAPKDSEGGLCFDRHPENLAGFLDDCLQFYKTIRERPAAVSLLTHEERFSYLKPRTSSLLEDFPRKFVEFIVDRLEASVDEYVGIQERAEALGLQPVVDLLLLHRP